MTKRTLTKVFVLVVALLMCLPSALSIFAADSVTETLTPKDTYVTDHTWAYGDTTYDSTIWQGDRYAEGYYHVYYVGGEGASDSNDGLTEATSFATIYGALTAAKSAGYTDNVLATAENMHHTKIVLLGDTDETKQTVSSGTKGNYIYGGIVTITAKEGVDATVHVGTSATNMTHTFLLLKPNANGKGYAELNLGEPDMKGTVSFDCTYFNAGDKDVEWCAVVRLGDENPNTNSVARMYDGFSIKNLAYNEETGKVIENSQIGSAINVDYGTFYMYGGTIENCYSPDNTVTISAVIFVHGRDADGLGFYMYGGTIQNCYAEVLIMTDKKTKNKAPAPKVAIYGGLIKNNYTKINSIGIDYGTGVIYGGTFENNYYDNNSKALLGDWESNGGKLYRSDSVKYVFDTKFTDLTGTERDPAQRKTLKGTEIKSVVMFANDGSAVGYGSTDGSTFTIKDASVVSAINELNYAKEEGYDIYTKENTTSCEYAIADGTSISAASSATYYPNAEKVHSFSVTERKEATDTEHGYIKYKCDRCNETKEDIIPALSHEHSYVDTIVDPTCTEQGYTIYLCSCGDKIIDNYTNPLGHDYSGAGTVVTAPTCTEKGYTTYTCQRENCTESHIDDYTSALGHNYVENVIVAPTETSSGKSNWTCDRCDKKVDDRVTYLAPDKMMFTVVIGGVEVRVSLKDFATYDLATPEQEYSLIIKALNDFTVDGVAYNKADITSVKVPLGVTGINNDGDGFKSLTNLVNLDFTGVDGLELAEKSFEGLTKLETVDFGNNMKINNYVFQNCTAIKKVRVGDGLKVNFAGVAIFNGVYNSDGNEVIAEFGASEIIFGVKSFRSENQDWNNNAKTAPWTKIIFSEGGKYTIAGYAFGGSQIEELVFPDGATFEFIEYGNNDRFKGNVAFYNCLKLKYVYIGDGVTKTQKLFNRCGAIETVVIMGKTTVNEGVFWTDKRTSSNFSMYVHSSECTIEKNVFQSIVTVNLYTLSENIDATLGCTGDYTIYLGIAHPYTAHTFDATCTENGYDGYITSCPCCGETPYGTTYKVFKNKAITGDADETVTLDKTNEIQALGHLCSDISLITAIKFANGFDKEGATKFTCQRCNEENCDGTIEAMFKALGYATKSDNTSIYGGFEVNLKTLEVYEKLNGAIKFGLIGGNASTDLTFENGVLQTEKAFQVEMTDRKFSKFGIMLNGFDPEVAKYIDFKFVMAVYVIDGDNMSFIQKEAETVEGVTSYYADKVNFTIGENKTELGAMTLKQIVLIQSKGTTVLAPTKEEIV